MQAKRSYSRFSTAPPVVVVLSSGFYLLGQVVCLDLLKIHEIWCSHKKAIVVSDLSQPNIYKALKPVWLYNLNWVCIASLRVAALLPKASLSMPAATARESSWGESAATAADLEIPCLCACQSQLPKLYVRIGWSSQKNSAIDLASSTKKHF